MACYILNVLNYVTKYSQYGKFHVIYILHFIKVYLSERQNNKRHKESFQLPVYSPNAHNSSSWAMLKPGDRELHPSIPHKWQRSKYMADHLLHPSVCISRKLEWKLRSNSILGTVKWDAGIPSSILTHCSTCCISAPLRL